MPRDGSGPGVVTTDTTGKVYFIGFNGEIKTLELDRFTDNHFFDYRDLNGDGKYGIYLISTGTGCHCVTPAIKTGSLPILSMNHRSYHGPSIYQFSATDRKLGVVCQK